MEVVVVAVVVVVGGGEQEGGDGGGGFRSEEQLPKPVRWRRVRSTEIRRQPKSGSKRKTLIPSLSLSPPSSHHYLPTPTLLSQPPLLLCAVSQQSCV